MEVLVSSIMMIQFLAKCIRNESSVYHNVTENESRDIKQEQLVQLLLAGKSVTAAAKEIGVTRVTASRWLKLEEVKTALAKGKAIVERSAHEIIIEKYREALEPACDVVVEIVKNSTEPAAARLKAVQMIQDRLAPLQGVEQAAPVQEGAIPQHLLQYATNEELEQVEKLVSLLEQRRDQAEQDREILERKRM
jgi:transposase-like protein